MKNFKLSRRDFLKLTGAMGMVTALGGIQALNTSCGNQEVTITHTETNTPTNETTISSIIPTKETSIPTGTKNADDEVIILVTSAYAQPGVVNGRKFVWTNMDNKTHTITCDEYEPNFEFTLKPGESGHMDLTGLPGLYCYWCREHPNESGEVVVT